MVGELSYGDQCVRSSNAIFLLTWFCLEGGSEYRAKANIMAIFSFIGGQEAASNDDSLAPFGGLDFNVNLIEARVMLMGSFDKIIKGIRQHTANSTIHQA